MESLNIYVSMATVQTQSTDDDCVISQKPKEKATKWTFGLRFFCHHVFSVLFWVFFLIVFFVLPQRNIQTYKDIQTFMLRVTVRPFVCLLQWCLIFTAAD